MRRQTICYSMLIGWLAMGLAWLLYCADMRGAIPLVALAACASSFWLGKNERKWKRRKMRAERDMRQLQEWEKLQQEAKAVQK